jgi:hypothetical protein
VPFCSDKQYNAVIDRHMLYVACTRAMHRLTPTHRGLRKSFGAARGMFTRIMSGMDIWCVRNKNCPVGNAQASLL